MKSFLAASLLVSAAAALPLVGRADEQPPQGTKPLLEVVVQLEKAGYDPVVDVSFDDGNWEVEAFKGDTAFELLVDPMDGNVVSEHRDDAEPKPSAGDKLLSEIISALADAGYTDINDLSFEGKNWEVEARRDNVKRELRVNPQTAEVISERVDD